MTTRKAKKKLLGKSWRTSVMGILGGIFFSILPLLQTGHFDIKKDWPYLVAGGGAALFGRTVKDGKVTGAHDEE